MQTIADHLRHNLLRFGTREAVVGADVRLTFCKLNKRVNRLANALGSLGGSTGKRIAVLSENSHQYLEIYFAAAKMGLCVVPLNFMFSDRELVQILAESDAFCCFVGDGYEGRIACIAADLPTVSYWISVQARRDGFLFYDDLLDNAPEQEPVSDVNENQMALLAFTNGTTGPPKGVMLSHRNIMQSASSISALLNLRPTDVGCYALPFYQTEVVNAFCMLMAGGKVVINRNADAAEILRLVQDERCTHINLVPALFDWLQRHADFERYNISSLKLMTYSGSSFPPAKLLDCVKNYWKPFIQSYGSTETAGCSIAALGPDDHILEGPGSQRLASAGKPLDGVQIKIVDGSSGPVRPEAVGEVVVKSNHIMLGYWKQPELTQKVLKNGWFHTGDVGYIDADGYLYVLGRKKDRCLAGGDRFGVDKLSEMPEAYPTANSPAAALNVH